MLETPIKPIISKVAQSFSGEAMIKQSPSVVEAMASKPVIGITEINYKYLLPYIKDTKNPLDISKIKKLGIPNFHEFENECLRGESLSSRKNRKFLIPLKKCGVRTIVDIREKYASEDYPLMCKKLGLKYYNIPIDSSSVDARKIIDNLPLLFRILNKGKVYIACAQGLHRTDIALALNFMFNPKKPKIPIMHGHFRNKGFKFDDISRRINSIKNNLTDTDIEKLGWDKKTFETEFNKRKTEFVEYNTKIAMINLGIQNSPELLALLKK